MDSQPGQKETYARLAGVRGVPEIIKTKKHDNKHFITMQLLGKSALDVMNECVITEKDALLMAVKAINIDTYREIYIRSTFKTSTPKQHIIYS